MKENYDKKMDENELEFQANSKKYFDPKAREELDEYRASLREKSEKYLSQIEKENMENLAKYSIMTFDGNATVKEKSIPKEKKLSAGNKTKIAILVAVGVLVGSVYFMDLANHPESYMTTHPDFEGAPSISEVFKRTPDNFGIGR